MVCFLLKDNRENRMQAWGIVICRWLAFWRIKYSWQIKISPILNLCEALGSVSSVFTRQTLFPVRSTVQGISRCHRRPGVSGLAPRGCPVGASYVRGRASPSPSLSFLGCTVCSQSPSAVLCSAGPQAFIKSDGRGHRESSRSLTGGARCLGYLGTQNSRPAFSYQPRCNGGQCLLICCSYCLCLTGNQRSFSETCNLTIYKGNSREG